VSWNAAARALLESGDGFDVRWLMRLEVKDRADGSPVVYGMWTGKRSRKFDVGGGPETFYAMFGHFVPPTMVFEPGTYIRKVEVQFVGLTPHARNILNAYDPRLAPVTLHQALFSLDGVLVDIRRRFKGEVNEAPQFTPPVNGVSKAKLKMVSSARRGTATNTAKKSDVMQQRRGGDRFRRYGSLGSVNADVWGNP